jgi:hypothetical protein
VSPCTWVIETWFCSFLPVSYITCLFGSNLISYSFRLRNYRNMSLTFQGWWNWGKESENKAKMNDSLNSAGLVIQFLFEHLFILVQFTCSQLERKVCLGRINFFSSCLTFVFKARWNVQLEENWEHTCGLFHFSKEYILCSSQEPTLIEKLYT